MSWRLANSLVKLRNQINNAYPDRNKASDGTIGDQAHAARISDHNPNSAGVVCAFDITHDMSHGVDIGALFNNLIGDNRIKYLIWNKRIWYPKSGWKAYTGTNPHTKHGHISVGGNYDDAKSWSISKPSTTPPPSGITEHVKKAIPPKTVSDYYKNFAGITVPVTDPATQNRFEDTTDDEFFYGLCVQLRDMRIASENQNAAMQKEINKLIDIANTTDSTWKEKERAYKETIEKLSQIPPPEIGTPPTGTGHPPVVDNRSFWQRFIDNITGKGYRK